LAAEPVSPAAAVLVDVGEGSEGSGGAEVGAVVVVGVGLSLCGGEADCVVGVGEALRVGVGDFDALGEESDEDATGVAASWGVYVVGPPQAASTTAARHATGIAARVISAVYVRNRELSDFAR